MATAGSHTGYQRGPATCAGAKILPGLRHITADDWDDGHSSGIHSFTDLRNLGACSISGVIENV